MNQPSSVSGLVDRLLYGLVNAQVYGTGHARVRTAADQAAERATTLCREAGAPSVMLGAVGDRIVHEGRPLLGASLFAKRLIERVRERGAGGIEFDDGVTAPEVLALVELLGRRAGPSSHVESNRDLEAHGARHVRFVPPYGASPGEALRSSVADAGPLVSLHQETVDLLQGITISVCQGHDIDMGGVAHAVDGVLAGLSRDAAAMHGMAHYPDHDFFTFGHSMRVGLLALDVARHTTDDPTLLRRIGSAALLHDVGKALIPWDILHKRGALSVEERAEMQRHPALGAGVLLENRDSDPLSVAAAYGHHRTTDGGGYPRSCGEYEQSLVTRLVKVCDVYEALTAVRPYKAAMTPARAYRVMLDMAGHFDPDLLRHFVRTVGIHPAGTRVRLDTGEVARVVRQTGDFHRPVVEVVEDGGGPVDAAHLRPYDLTRPEPGGATLVEAALPALAPAEAVV